MKLLVLEEPALKESSDLMPVCDVQDQVSTLKIIR